MCRRPPSCGNRLTWRDESQFLLNHADVRVRIWLQKYESMNQTCLGSPVVLVWGTFCCSIIATQHHLNAYNLLHPFISTTCSSYDIFFRMITRHTIKHKVCQTACTNMTINPVLQQTFPITRPNFNRENVNLFYLHISQEHFHPHLVESMTGRAMGSPLQY